MSLMLFHTFNWWWLESDIVLYEQRKGIRMDWKQGLYKSCRCICSTWESTSLTAGIDVAYGYNWTVYNFTWDRINPCASVDDCRRELFTQKGRSIEFISFISSALFQHAKRASYQTRHVWRKAFLRVPELPELPDPADRGWTKKNSSVWQCIWKTLLEACKSYYVSKYLRKYKKMY